MRATDVMRPFAAMRLARMDFDLDAMPVPEDVAQQRVPGPEPDRVLLFGNGPATGFGVRSHALALPGELARRTAARTGRGMVLDLSAHRRATAEAHIGTLDDVRLWRYDAIVVTVGALDASMMTSFRRWRTAFGHLLDYLDWTAAPGTPLVVLGVPRPWRGPSTPALIGDITDRHTDGMNEIVREICDVHDCATYVAPPPADEPGRHYQSAEGYAEVAEVLAGPLAEVLDARLVAEGTTARMLRDQEEPFDERVAAVRRLGVLDTALDEQLLGVVRRTRDRFAADAAAVGLIDRDRVWNAAAIGMPENIPLAMSVCPRTVLHDRAHVVGDLWDDPLASAELLAAGARFYAGYPLESPDGYRIGTLCVFGAEPRDASTFDAWALGELAAEAQRELWRIAPRARV